MDDLGYYDAWKLAAPEYEGDCDEPNDDFFEDDSE